MEPCNRSGMTRATIRPSSRPMRLNLTRPLDELRGLFRDASGGMGGAHRAYEKIVG